MKPLVFHCHMPKTAGSALNRQVLLPRHDPACAMLAYGVKFERKRRYPLGEMALPEGVDLIAGHLPVGYMDDLGRPVLHVSILRDPVDRMFSFLNFVAVAPRHGLRKRFKIDMKDVARTDPERFVQMMLGDDMVRLRQTNVMTRLASGMARLSKKSPDESHLAKALARVDGGHYEVGVQERFEIFAARLNDRLDAEGTGQTGATSDIAQGDKAEKRLERVINRDDATPSMIAAVRKANALDQRLYEYVHTRT